MPLATTMAGVNMRLKAGGIRWVEVLEPDEINAQYPFSEMHWHVTAEVCELIGSYK